MTLFNYGVQVVAIIALMNYYEKWCYQEFKVEEDSSGEILIVESHSGVIEYRRLGSATTGGSVQLPTQTVTIWRPGKETQQSTVFLQNCLLHL